MSFNSLGLHDQLIEGVVAAGLTEPTAIQSLAIPPALEGKDVFGRAPGDSGRVEAYIFPLLEFLARSVRSADEWVPPLALVLSPTRKSVQDVQAATLRYGKYLSIRAVGVFGGTDIDKQTRLLKRRTEVVVATPGRLLDHITRGSVDLTRIGFLVIDDMDKMVELGLTADIGKILNAVPATRQSMLFSGVLNADVTSMAELVLRQPVTVDVGGTTLPAPAVRERVVATKREARMRTLLHLLQSESMDRVIILSQKDYEAERILRALKGKGIASLAIKGDWTNDDRDQARSSLRDGSLRVLVGTEEAAGAFAGEAIAHVIHYDFPQHRWRERTRGATQGAGTISGADTVTFTLDRDRANPQRSERMNGHVAHGTTHAREGGRTTQRRSGISNNHEGRRVMAEHTVKQFEKPTKATKHRKKNTIVFARRKKPLKKLETFSSDHSGAGW